jgi:hypothetical protein
MYYHSRKTGFIFPLPLYLFWRFRKYFLAFSVAFNLLAPVVWILTPKAPVQTEAQKTQALHNWRPASCSMPSNPKDVEFCKNFKGFR